MYHVRIVTDLDECREVWQRLMPQAVVSDLWEFRACFHRNFQRRLRFVVAENDRGPCGLLPLSWIDESRCWGFFPGETWEGKTWIEQNRVVALDGQVLDGLMRACAGDYHLRYLLPLEAMPQPPAEVDEIGYLFCPPAYGYDIENYYQEFSRKSAKRLKRDLEAVTDQGVSYRYDDPSDLDHMVALNVSCFGGRSYFSDERFCESFRSVADLLAERGWLRVTTIMIGGEVAAVDMGCLYRGVYTLLAGGANRSFPGVAKLINVHHMIRGCRERMDCLDFLCGDFSWKKLFHLRPRPLYLLSNVPHAAHDALTTEDTALAEVGCVA